MAKHTSESRAKENGGEARTKRAAGRRETEKKPDNPILASARDRARSQPTSGAPNPDEVRRRAYELYVRRGGTPGGHLDDWYEAERQLESRTRL